MLALRYIYVLALSLWFGGTLINGLVAPPETERALHLFFLLSYVSSGLLVSSLLSMALLGPRPSSFAARLAVAVAMSGLTLYSGLGLHALPLGMTLLIAAGGLTLLFWEALDGTRAV